MNPFPTPGRFHFVPPWIEIQTDFESEPFGIKFQWQDPDSALAYFHVENGGPIQRIQLIVSPPPELFFLNGFYWERSDLRDSYPKYLIPGPMYDDTYPVSYWSSIWSELTPILMGLAVGIFFAWAGSKARQELFGGDR